VSQTFFVERAKTVAENPKGCLLVEEMVLLRNQVVENQGNLRVRVVP